jgi:cytochrome c5
MEGTQGYRDEIGRAPEPYKGPPRTGAQVYAYRCASCHAKTTQGAPMPGDDVEWGLRARQGMYVLMRHTIDGYKQLLMPPRGGCGNCTDAELKAAVVYMLKIE